MVGGASHEPRYKAFLSYSHADAAEARRVHRRLESYRLPKRLVGSGTRFGPVPPRLWPIFRDREELAASADLTETVRAALSDSAAMIVLCSPHAAASQWVAEEIRTFRALHPDRPLVAAIIAGNPPGCFPAPIYAIAAETGVHEPLAADLRRTGDGRHLGTLKLIAGVTGVGLDDLVQRDARRQVRNVTAITAVALIAMLIMAALAWFAIDARREAERQRTEAEGLVEFMLTDLRDRLKDVGRLDALEAANARALLYYGDSGEVAGLTDDSLARRARVLQAIGDDSIAGHDLDAAQRAYEEAHRATSVLLDRDSNSAERLLEHSKSDGGLGRIFEMRHDWVAARRHFEALAVAAERLVAMKPDNVDYLLLAGTSGINLGNIHFSGTRDFASAQHFYEQAVRRFDQVATQRPADLHVRLAQANAYGWLADSFFVRQMWPRSLQTRQRQYEIVARLHCEHRANADVSYRLAAAQRGLAHSLMRSNDPNGARSHLLQATATVEALVARDPRNGEWAALRARLATDARETFAGSSPVTTRQAPCER